MNALAFDPILVFEMADGSHYYPGSNDAKFHPPEGGKPIFIDTLRKADAYVRETNAREQIEIDQRTEARRNQMDRIQRENRAQMRSELEKRGISRRNVDAIMADRDGAGPDKAEVMRQYEAVMAASGAPFDRDKAERMYELTERTRRNPDYRSRPQASFDIEVMSFDASNRRPHNDESTGWKNRK
jgi:hypothetical protein